jgi:hypothetical protein
MANIDQQLRGGGFPDSVSKRNIDVELASMVKFIDELVAAEVAMVKPKLLQKSLISILFLSADPTNASRLRLGEELREIQEKLQLGKFRERFKLEQRMSVRPADISQALLDIQPEIIHFSCHGTANGELCFENQIGETHPVHPDALAALFEQFAHQVNCVILNACYSETQATAIAKHIKYVIGMNQAIGDNAAISFAIGFYQALGAGRSIEDAYKLGCVQIRLQGIPEHLTPVFYALKNQDNVPGPALYTFYIEHPSVESLSQPAPVPQPQNVIDTVLLESEIGLDYQSAIERIYTHLDSDDIDKAVMTCLRIARNLKDYLKAASFLYDICDDPKELQKTFLDDTPDLEDEIRKSIRECALEEWINSRTLDFSLDSEDDSKRVLGTCVGELNPDIHRMETWLEDIDNSTPYSLLRKSQLRLKIKASEIIKQRIKARCLNYAIYLEKQLNTQD